MERHICDLCGQVIPPHSHYVVRIEVYADPSVPAMSMSDIEEMDFEATTKDLLQQMKHLSADELQDQVHRRFDYRICRPCQAKFLANPLGKPRVKSPAGN